MISTMVAPRTVADDHSTRLPFPEVTGLPPGSAASTADQTLEATASLSADGCYRWSLTRRWAPGPTAAWIMLNPSRADADTDDPTLRRVIGFAQASGFGQISVTNLYAWRSPSPSVLRRVADPVGVENDQAILDGTAGADLIVAAWGTHADPDRAAAVLELLSHRTVWCLGLTRSKQPRHPLYAPARTPLQIYRRPRHDWTDWQQILDPGGDEQLHERFCPTCGVDEIGVEAIGWGTGRDGRHRGQLEDGLPVDAMKRAEAAEAKRDALRARVDDLDTRVPTPIHGLEV